MQRAIVLFIVVGLAGAPALAAWPEDVAVPIELLAGTAGGYVGAFLGSVTLSWALSAGSTGWDSLARAILGAFLGYTGGTIVGSSVGVIGAAAILGVEGDVAHCFLGAAAGTGLVIGLGVAFEIPQGIFPFTPPVAAAVATAGFHTSADSLSNRHGPQPTEAETAPSADSDVGAGE